MIVWNLCRVVWTYLNNVKLSVFMLQDTPICAACGRTGNPKRFRSSVLNSVKIQDKIHDISRCDKMLPGDLWRDRIGFNIGLSWLMVDSWTHGRVQCEDCQNTLRKMQARELLQQGVPGLERRGVLFHDISCKNPSLTRSYGVLPHFTSQICKSCVDGGIDLEQFGHVQLSTWCRRPIGRSTNSCADLPHLPHLPLPRWSLKLPEHCCRPNLWKSITICKDISNKGFHDFADTLIFWDMPMPNISWLQFWPDFVF